MQTEFHKNRIIVIRDKTDPKFYGCYQAKGESSLLHALKKHLNSKGYDLIKKRMWKDGHLVDECQQYLRARRKTGDPEKDIMIYNTFFQIRGANSDFNEGRVILGLEEDIFNQ